MNSLGRFGYAVAKSGTGTYRFSQSRNQVADRQQGLINRSGNNAKFIFAVKRYIYGEVATAGDFVEPVSQSAGAVVYRITGFVMYRRLMALL